MKKWVLGISIACILLTLYLLLPSSVSHGSLTYITAHGTQLQLNGKQFKFLGVNRYNILTNEDGQYIGCGSPWTHAELDQMFSELHGMGANAVRFWAFQSFTASDSAYFSQMDYLANILAPKYGIKLIPVLENEWRDCTYLKKDDSWYKSGYLSPYGKYTLSYKDYIHLIVPRYKNNLNILAWQLMNEAEDDSNDGTCASGKNLYQFAKNMSTYVHSLDPNHLISLGTIGSGQCGTGGILYENISKIPYITILEGHDYNSETTPLPGSGQNGLADDLQIGKKVKKPFFIGEAGILTGCGDTNCFTPTERASYFKQKIISLFANGGSGYLLWSYRDHATGVQPSTGYEFDSRDPLYRTIQLLAPLYTQSR